MVGRLAPQKAPEVFLAACAELAARVPEARFVLIGDGPMREEVAGAIRATGLEERMLHVPGLQDAFTVMPQLDVFALSSRYEAGPYAPLEAMRAGVPVVLTDVPGNRDTVVDERTGLRVPADDPGALAAAVERLLAEPELAARLAAAAREDLAARFDVRRTGARTLEVYRSLLRS
jgi:glycosyltransferase involved in cell wall biosynthesis